MKKKEKKNRREEYEDRKKVTKKTKKEHKRKEQRREERKEKEKKTVSFQCLSVGVCCDWANVIVVEKLRCSAKRGASLILSYLILMRPQDFQSLQRVPVARREARSPGIQ